MHRLRHGGCSRNRVRGLMYDSMCSQTADKMQQRAATLAPAMLFWQHSNWSTLSTPALRHCTTRFDIRDIWIKCATFQSNLHPLEFRLHYVYTDFTIFTYRPTHGLLLLSTNRFLDFPSHAVILKIIKYLTATHNFVCMSVTFESIYYHNFLLCPNCSLILLIMSLRMLNEPTK